MDVLNEKNILDLCARSDKYLVSVYMPTGIGSANSGRSSLVFKGLLKDARERLISLEAGSKDVESILERGLRLADDGAFWLNQRNGLCVFISDTDIKYFVLPIGFKESVAVSNYYNILPLIDFVFDNKDFYLLALNYGGCRLYQANRYYINEITPKSMAVTLRDIESGYEKVESKFSHIAKDGKEKSTEGVIVHGRGGLKESEKLRVQQFLRQVEKDVSNVLKEAGFPLVIAGTTFSIAEYKRINSYKNLLEEAVVVNIDPTNKEKLYREALSIFEKKYEDKKDSEIQKYFELRNIGRASNDAQEVFKAASTGGIDTLFINKDKDISSSFSEKSEVAMVDISTRHNFCGYANLASILTIRNGGRVVILNEEKMPEKSSIAANFRF